MELGLLSCSYIDGVGLIVGPLKVESWIMALISLLILLLVVDSLLIVWLIRWVGLILGRTNNIHMSSVCDPICHSVLVLIPISRFVIGLGSILVGLFVDFNNTILDEPLLKDHSLFLNVFVGLKTVHDHMMG